MSQTTSLMKMSRAMEIIQENSVAIHEALGSENTASFEERYHQIVELAQTNPANPTNIWEQLLSLFEQYPATAPILSEKAPDLFDQSERVSSSSHVDLTRRTPTGPNTPLAVLQSDRDTPDTTLPNNLDSVNKTEENVDRERELLFPSDASAVSHQTEQDVRVTPPTSGQTASAKQGKENQMVEPLNSKKHENWSPEQIIQFFKEVVTSVMGLVVIGFTLYLVNSASSYVGDATKLSEAKDLLLLLFSLTGVIIGYYFGRIPADAHAAQAQKEANDATAQSRQVSSRAAEIARSIDTIIVDTNRTRGGDLDPNTVEDLQRLREELSDLVGQTQLR
jgi:hypothetical protein